MTNFELILKRLSFIIIICLSPAVVAQNSDTSTDRLWLLILPGTISNATDKSLENEIADIVSDIAWESGRFEVFDRFGVRDLLVEYPPALDGSLPDSVILAIGDEIECDEALIVDVMSFKQIGVPPEEDEAEKNEKSFIASLFDGLFSGTSDDYSDNINTRLTVQLRNIDLINGEEIDRFHVQVSYTGGTKADSEEKALEDFQEVVSNEVRMIYQLISEVTSVDGLDLNLRLGSNLGVNRSTYFEIIEPNQIKSKDDEEITSPGKSVGLARVQDVSDTLNHSLIIRQWGFIGPGYYANEFNRNIHGIQLFFLPKFPGDYMYIGAQFHNSPLGKWDIGGELHYTSVKDSYNETENGLGFGVFLARRLLTLTSFMLYSKMGLNIDIPFKFDDDGQSVTTAVFSGSLGISCSLMLTKKTDIEFNLGYRKSTKSSDWTYSESEERYDAFWLEDAPVVDISGFYFTIGYKILIF
jgi:hypothetical protein